MAWLTMHAHEWNASNEDQVQMDILHGWGLVALQGPASAAALAKLLPPSFPLSSLHFGQSTFAPLSEGSASFHIARGGYTGEDGFEISFPPHLALDMSRKLLDLEGVKLAGLAARDSLRLEAGLCLYGHDLDETIGVGEAGLGWVVGARSSWSSSRIDHSHREGPQRNLASLHRVLTLTRRFHPLASTNRPHCRAWSSRARRRLHLHSGRANQDRDCHFWAPFPHHEAQHFDGVRRDARGETQEGERVLRRGEGSHEKGDGGGDAVDYSWLLPRLSDAISLCHAPAFQRQNDTAKRK